ncbi:HU family DNA-binding protein [uncultured Parabacteroides sp.]|uniref:HU family DNA-binding protein n=1 Tax=uncultured Parabacteroides sp. TaxID=512312 RepID=UPI00258D0C5E|nr:HU family DNA-binding protein [uncultured Parabacteroides sp.]
MKYKLVPRKNPQKKDDPPKVYAQPVYDGTIDTDFIGRQIAGRSSLTTGDILNVLSNFFDELPTYMLLGQTVKINGLGTFRISFTSDGAESEDKFKTTAMKNPRVLFKPDPAFRKRIVDEIKYTIQRPAGSDKEDEGDDDRPVIE